jgi:hypothetical protein
VATQTEQQNLRKGMMIFSSVNGIFAAACAYVQTLHMAGYKELFSQKTAKLGKIQYNHNI